MSGAPTGPEALWQAVGEAAAGRRGHEAIAAPEGTAGLEALLDRAERLARELAGVGLEPGAPVVVALPGGLDFIVVVLALWRLGHAVALGSPEHGLAEATAILQGVSPAAVVREDHAAASWAAGASASPRLIGAGILGHPTVLDRRSGAGAGAGAALIKFSSGSTGSPKAILLSAPQVLAEARSVVEGLALDGSDRVLAPVPLHHSYGFDLGVLPMLAGAASLVVASPPVPRRFWDELAGHRATVCLGVPAIYRFALRLAPADAAPPAGLRWLLSCTAPLRADIIVAFHRRFGAVLSQHYGSSETGAVTTQSPADALDQPEAVGRAMPGVRLQVVNDLGQPVQDGSVGRVLVRGPAVAMGYGMGAPPGESPFRPPDGFLMGDRGTLRDGILSVQGRADDLINVGGLKVSPAEVVAVLESHPAVLEAAALGVADAAGEEHVCAMVVLAGEVSEAELQRYCRERLAEHKVPRRIEVRQALPRGPSGKIRLDPKEWT